MSSSICQAFEANAWRKDLCSHCFRSKEEHEQDNRQLAARYPPAVNCDPSESSVTDCVSSQRRYQSPIGSSRSCSYLNSSALRPLTCSVSTALDSLPTCPSIGGHQVIHPLTSSQHSTAPLTKTKRCQSSDYLLTSNAAPTQPRRSSDINRFLLSLQPKDDVEPAMTSVEKIPAGTKAIKGSRSVQFPDEAVHVIGYGGEECFYSDEDDTIDDDDDDEQVDDDNLTEEERKVIPPEFLALLAESGETFSSSGERLFHTKLPMISRPLVDLLVVASRSQGNDAATSAVY